MMPTKYECQRMMSKIGFKLGVSPRLISERLLDDLDKSNMMAGEISIALLEDHTVAFMESGFPDYAHGKTLSDEDKTSVIGNNKPKTLGSVNWDKYRKPFVEYGDSNGN
jgi:hypothetical protein